jgi:hypothetical protein
MNSTTSRKRSQIIFSDEAWAVIESLICEANRDFEVGTVTYSNIVNELVLTGKVDIKALQVKRTNVKRSLRFMAAQENVDLDAVIKTLTELKSKASRKIQKTSSAGEEV